MKEKLLSKLRQPLHFDFICNNILKTGDENCMKILSELIKDNLIEEDKKYYKIKKK